MSAAQITPVSAPVPVPPPLISDALTARLDDSSASPQTFSIDPHFKSLIPEPTQEEIEQLETNILRDGCQEPLSLWNDPAGYILIDGHHRYAICKKHGIPYQTAPVDDLPDRDAVELWIEQRQLGRRNLSDDQRAVIADSIVTRRSELAVKERASQGGTAKAKKAAGTVVCLPGDVSGKQRNRNKETRSAVAREYNIPEWDIRKVREIKKDANRAPELLARVRNREISLAEAKRQVRRAEVTETLNSIEALEAKKLAGIYDVVVIDPPWPMEKIELDARPNQVKLDYPVMSVDEIADQVGTHLASHLADDAHVFLWTTQRFLRDAFKLVDGWGLRQVVVFVWHKPNGFQPIGLPKSTANLWSMPERDLLNSSIQKRSGRALRLQWENTARNPNISMTSCAE